MAMMVLAIKKNVLLVEYYFYYYLILSLKKNFYSVAREMQTFYCHEEMHSVGIGAQSPNDDWKEYARINPTFREMLETLYTPRAYKALHYDPSTFKRLFELPGQSFDQLEIFRLETDGKSFAPVADRSPYLPIFAAAQQMVRANHRNSLNNLLAGRTEDIDCFVNMGFACESSVEWMSEPGERAGTTPRMADPRFKRMVLKGYFPYLSNRSAALDELMFFFTCASTDRIALVAAPDSEREACIDFIRKRGAMQLFDKVCAQCGKTGNDLFKCPCKAVRYCCADCQRAHWAASHKAVCAWRAV
jgi:hypothetical protein